MRYRDWGVRSPRWSGVRSETIEVCGVSVHCLATDAGPATAPNTTTQLVVHPLAASGSFMLDLIRPLSAYGPVIAPDLPGTIFGHTPTPRVNAPRVEHNARFLRAFTSALGLDRVVVHGWSMGAVVGLHFAANTPERVGRLVLATPPLPAPLTALQRLGWQTLGRLMLLVGPPSARALVRLWGRRAIDRKLAVLDETVAGRFDGLGGDPSRIAPDNVALWAEQFAELRAHPERMGYAATAFASVVSGLFVDRRPTLEAIDRIAVPVLVLLGDQDLVIERSTIDHVLARRPEWNLHVLESAGHLAPLEMPERYAEAIGRWLGHPAATGVHDLEPSAGD
jgi:pimeloyl-ACP methyl ester carboxylesterase